MLTEIISLKLVSQSFGVERFCDSSLSVRVVRNLQSFWSCGGIRNVKNNKNILRQTAPWSFVLSFSSILFSMFCSSCFVLSVFQHRQPDLRTEDNLKKDMIRVLICCLKNILRKQRRQQFLAFSGSNQERFRL